MREVVDGIFHWTAPHPNIGMDVSSYYVAQSRTLIDPMASDEAVEWLGSLSDEPARIVLTNRHHLRGSARLSQEFDCPILCHRAGLHEFEGGPEVEGFAFGDELAPNLTALEVGVICEEETALHVDVSGGALAVADGVVNYGGPRFVPDHLLGDQPELIKRGLRESYSRLLDRRFDAILFAHGDPIASDAKKALRAFTERE